MRRRKGDGTLKRFKFPIRTTPEGSIDCYGGKPTAKMADISVNGFFTGTADGGVTKGYRAGNPSELIRK